MKTIHANVPKKLEFLLVDLMVLSQEEILKKTRRYILDDLFSSKTFNQFGLFLEILNACKSGKCEIKQLKRRGYTTIQFSI